MRLIQLSKRLYASPIAAAAAMAASTLDTLAGLHAALPLGVRAVIDREGGVIVIDDAADPTELPIVMEV